MLKFLIDAREAVRNKSGIGVVSRELIKRFETNKDDDFLCLRING